MLVNFGSLGYEFTYADDLDWRGESIRKSNVQYGAAWVEYDAPVEIFFHARFSMQSDQDGFDPGIYRARYVDLARVAVKPCLHE